MPKDTKKHADAGNGTPAAAETSDLTAMVDSNGANIAAVYRQQ